MLQDDLLRAYPGIKEGIDKAPESPTPFPVIQDDKLSVIGDANETQVNKHDYKIKFIIPADYIDDKDEDEVKEVEYKNVRITPRQRASVVTAMCRLLPYFRNVKEDGTVEDYQPEEVVALMSRFDDPMLDTLYNLVATVLRIDKELIEFMDYLSVIEATAQIILDYPDMVNEAEAFF